MKFPYHSSKYCYWFGICLSVLALLLGGIIYILFRTSKPVFFHWLGAAELDYWSIVSGFDSPSFRTSLPDWVVFSLPDGLWAFAYALSITVIWSGRKSWLRYIWMASIPILVLGYEILQYAGIVPGTFCMQDMALGLTGLITGIIAGNKIHKPIYHEKKYE